MGDEASPFSGDGGDAGGITALLEEMEDDVKDAILTGATKDTVLDKLILFTMRVVVEDRHIAQNPLEEPAFFERYFKKWVADGIKELETTRKEKEKLEKEITGAA